MEQQKTAVQQKRYLKLGHKLAYGAGDMATNYCYGFITAFMLMYLTTSVGLNAGIVGTLMMISRVLDGITDVLCGTLIDRTRSKMGKAKPWMFWTIVPITICQILLFSTPSMDQVLQYAYFFVLYTVLNDLFFTANNVAYSTLSALITTNKNERVQLGVYRFVFATIGSLVVSSLTMMLVGKFGGGAAGWRWTAIIFSLLFLVIDYISCLSLKELPLSELGEAHNPKNEKTTLWQNIRYVARNKFFVFQLVNGTLYNALNNITTAVGAFYMSFRLNNPAMLGIFSLTMVFPLIISLGLTPLLVKKLGIYKANLFGICFTTFWCIPFAIFAFSGQVVPMLICSCLRWLGSGPQIGTGGALSAEVAKYSYLKDGVHIEGSIFSCSSMGSKIGQGLGTAGAGWLLAAASFDGLLAIQPQSAISMITFMYAVFPLIISAIMALMLYLMKVERANDKLERTAAAE